MLTSAVIRGIKLSRQMPGSCTRHLPSHHVAAFNWLNGYRHQPLLDRNMLLHVFFRLAGETRQWLF